MTLFNIFRSKSIFPNFLWYDFGDRRPITGCGQQLGLRNTVQNTGPVWWFPFDLVLADATDKEGSQQTESGKYKRIAVDKYFPSPPVETPPPAPEGPPPVIIPDPPPVDPPPVVPPVVPPTTYKIKTITRGKGLPLIVFFGVAKGLAGKLIAPGGREQTFVTGGKPEFGPGGTEAGYAVTNGDYNLAIGADNFTVAMAGEFTKIEFEDSADTSVKNTILESILMSRDAAMALLQKLNQLYAGVFRIE